MRRTETRTQLVLAPGTLETSVVPGRKTPAGATDWWTGESGTDRESGEWPFRDATRPRILRYDGGPAIRPSIGPVPLLPDLPWAHPSLTSLPFVQSRLPPRVRALPPQILYPSHRAKAQAGRRDPDADTDRQASKRHYRLMAGRCFAIIAGETGSASEGARSVFRKSMSAARVLSGSFRYAAVTDSASP